ncbi:sugar ABC transporter ATP-binding protein [Polyangium fumosum]|uniref:sugar ABC transporter ATP-binding protein n=1 Tax=Polyangium fumosum TaxID=889272 RepID=UPI001B868BBD|nr:sugar ABC transporter ATP-binding protein [Polyangium fumosum]
MAREVSGVVAQGVTKAYGATTALAGVDLDVRAGEVHALLGENGAGKSTLVKILAGAVRPDGGRLTLDGAPFAPKDPAAARAAGVRLVSQERALCPHMTVEENVLLGGEPTRFGVLKREEARAIAARALLAIDPTGAKKHRLRPDALVRDLGPGERQLVEIARAITEPRCRLLLLDEPTSSLGADDVEALFAVVSRLREAGLAVVYISHHLDEIRRIADRFTVIRDGRTAGTGRVAEATPADIVTMMAGRSIEDLYPRSPRVPGDVVLSTQDLAGAGLPVRASLVLRRGEVLGIAGLVGSGRTELLRAIFGLDRVRRGEVRVGAYVGPASPAARLAQGVGLLSEDRGGEGLALGLTIADNVTLSRLVGLGPLGFVTPARMRAAAARFIEKLGVVCAGPDAPVGSLSGGNQQKVALARLLYHDVDVLLLDEPTRGVDVGARAAIYALIDRLACESNKAVLVVSSAAEELVGIADRIAVMHKGELGPARPVGELDVRAVMLEQAGAS